jgi:hypothetical protein
MHGIQSDQTDVSKSASVKPVSGENPSASFVFGLNEFNRRQCSNIAAPQAGLSKRIQLKADEGLVITDTKCYEKPN